MGLVLVILSNWLGTFGDNLCLEHLHLSRAELKSNILTQEHDKEFQVQANSKNYKLLQLPQFHLWMTLNAL